ncbi:MAG: hypothetical protein LQ338_007928 [Usnochroma carphineum]|nr:MAG: hypothetical protein LQ338_007928 [Usnochroma carphineum]
MLIAGLRNAASKSVTRRIAICVNHGAASRHKYKATQPLRLLQTHVSPPDTVPFRKQLKDEAKRNSDRKGNDVSNTENPIDDATLQRWELTAFQKGALLPAIRAALALGCHVQQRSQFDRKHYFYADQPAGYQITQYYQPFATNGTLLLYGHDGIAPEDGDMAQVGIKQIQLEQDTAKTVLQPPNEAMLDFNRVGHPLIEIITLPQIHQPQTAAACVKKIQALLQAVNAVTTGMELGGLRADVNVSVRQNPAAGHVRRGQFELGQRTEIKNLSSIKAVEDAIIAERNRQISVLNGGGSIEGETRGWTLGASDTVKLRGKEGEVDYRYMPDPDLRPLFISEDLVADIAENLPQSSDRTVQELIQEHGLTMKDAKTLTELDNGERLDYFDQVCEELAALSLDLQMSRKNIGKRRQPFGVTVANWVLHEMGGILSAGEMAFSPDTLPAGDLAYIIMMLEMGKITGRTAKQLFAKKFNGDNRNVQTIIDQENLLLEPLSDGQYVAMARHLMDSNPAMVAAIKKGQIGKLGFFIGQMMRKGEGKVVARKAEATLKHLMGISNQ